MVSTKKYRQKRSISRKRKGERMRPVPIIRVFGYGSLMSVRNLQQRLEKKITRSVFRLGKLKGWQRSFSKGGRDHVYLTLRKVAGIVTDGVLIDVTPPELAVLARHESGYALLDVTEGMVDYAPTDPPVYCFIAEPLEVIPEKISKIRRSYINTCLEGVPLADHKKWLAESCIPEGVIIAEED